MRGERKSLVLAREVLGLGDEGCYEFIRRVIEGSSFVRDLVRGVVVDYGKSCYGIKGFWNRGIGLASEPRLSGYGSSVVNRLLMEDCGVDKDLVIDARRMNDMVIGVMFALRFFSRYVSYVNLVRYLSGRRSDLGGVYVLDDF